MKKISFLSEKFQFLGGEIFYIHCSAVITRSSGAMNTDRVIRGPRYTEHDNHTHLHHCSFLQLL